MPQNRERTRKLVWLRKSARLSLLILAKCRRLRIQICVGLEWFVCVFVWVWLAGCGDADVGVRPCSYYQDSHRHPNGNNPLKPQTRQQIHAPARAACGGTVSAAASPPLPPPLLPTPSDAASCSCGRLLSPWPPALAPGGFPPVFFGGWRGYTCEQIQRHTQITPHNDQQPNNPAATTRSAPPPPHRRPTPQTRVRAPLR